MAVRPPSENRRSRHRALDPVSRGVPEIFTGLRVGLSPTLIGTAPGEMLASEHGLGHLLMNAIILYSIEAIMAVTFLLVVFAAGVNGILLAIDRRLHFRA
jgi:NitT/TauT family transport system permease protein